MKQSLLITFLNKGVKALPRLSLNLFARYLLWKYDVKLAGGLKLYGAPIISKVEPSEISLGAGVTLTSMSRYTDLGVNHPVILRTLQPGARIAIADHVGISGASICAAQHISIGKDVLLGANVMITDTDFHPVAALGRRKAKLSEAASAPVVIEDNVFIGANSIVLKGVSIGENTVVGAGSIVTKSLPANVIAAGNPCKVIKPLEVKT